MVVDVITFNGEYDLFELRYQILKDYVDEFIVVEFDKTFSGKDKLNYTLDSDLVFYDPIHQWPKVNCFHVGEELYSKYKDLALSSPNTEYGKGAEHWIREFCQKESIKDCLTHLNDDDIVFIGDCDEIWDPEYCLGNFDGLEPNDYSHANGTAKINLKVYAYYLNNRSNEEFYGTLVGKYKYIKSDCLNHLRSNFKATRGGHGWHFTSMAPELRRKLEDSYTKETYANEQVIANLEENIANNRDFLGRDFKYWVDESEWPQYLKDNREKYKHLLKP